jgi:hypothetical protein
LTELVAPFVFKITPLHGPHGKHRLPSSWMHVYSCVAWQETYCISGLLLGADTIENFPFYCCLCSCLQSCCLTTRWSNPLQYSITHTEVNGCWFCSPVSHKFYSSHILLEGTCFCSFRCNCST